MIEKKKILILEDNVLMQSLLRTLLELESFQVTCPSLPLDEPMKIIQEINPDVILMDVNLPGINGLSLLELIRAADNLKNIRIIMSTGSDSKQESLDAGADSFLMKPFMPDELIRLIKAYTN